MALRAMQSLAGRVFPEAGWRHSGDLAWAAACADSAPDTRPTAVWSTGDMTVAWGWLESPGELTMQVDPAHPDLADQVLAWARRATGSARPSVTIGAHETHLVAALTAHRFEEDTDGPFFACLGRPLTDLPPLLTPPGGTDEPTAPQLRGGMTPGPAGPDSSACSAIVRAAAVGRSRCWASQSGRWPWRESR